MRTALVSFLQIIHCGEMPVVLCHVSVWEYRNRTLSTSGIFEDGVFHIDNGGVIFDKPADECALFP